MWTIYRPGAKTWCPEPLPEAHAVPDGTRAVNQAGSVALEARGGAWHEASYDLTVPPPITCEHRGMLPPYAYA